MGKYTKDNHDCANDGTCGQSITDFRIGDSKISFHDNHGRTIAQIPKLPNGNSFTYYNNLYKTAQSRNFGENTKYVGVQDVLPNQFNFEYGKLNCVIHYDNVSQQEQEQMKLDIKNAYEAYKAKFCIASNIQVTVHTYVFNNRDDYRGYGTLVPKFSWSQSSFNISGGMTNGESVLLYKDVYTDNVLAHEFGHVFQMRLSEAKVEELDRINNQLMANAIGLEVEEKNYKAICKQMGVDEYKNRGLEFIFKYKGITGSIYREDLSEDEKFQIIQRVKNSGLDEYEDHGSMFQFKYKGTLYKYHKNLSEEEKFKAIQNVKNIHELVDEYKDHGWMFSFKYKGTTGSIYRKDLLEEEKFQIIQRVKNSGLDEYEDHGWMFQFKYKGTLYKYHKNLSEEEKFKAIQNVKNIHELVDEYKDHGWMFSFKYKGTTGSIYRKDLSEEEKFQIIQRVKNSGLDEYEDHGWMFQFKYKGTLYKYHKNLSEEEKFQIIQRVKNSGLDEYEDRGWMFSFKYEGTTYSIYRKDLSEEEKFQFIQDIKNSHESLVSECDGLGNENTALSIYVDENKEISRMYFQNSDKNIFKQLDKTLISRSKSEEEANENRTNPEPEEEQKGDEYTEFTGVLQFKYKGTNYDIQHKGYLSAEKEKLQFIKDIKNSHESLISECDGLNEGPLSQNATVVIFVDENKEISQMYFHNPDKNMSEWLDKTLISRSKSEEDVDDTDPKPGKEPEPESGKEPKEDISRSKPEQEVEKSNEVEQSNVDVEEEKSNQQDTQQPSNFLSSIIFPAMKSVIDSISSLFSWLFGSKEEEQSDNNLSLLNLSEEQSDDNLSLLKPDVNQDADENYVGNYSLCNHDYHQHDDLI